MAFTDLHEEIEATFSNLVGQTRAFGYEGGYHVCYDPHREERYRSKAQHAAEMRAWRARRSGRPVSPPRAPGKSAAQRQADCKARKRAEGPEYDLQQAAYRAEHSRERAEYMKAWRAANREHVRAYRERKAAARGVH